MGLEGLKINMNDLKKQEKVEIPTIKVEKIKVVNGREESEEIKLIKKKLKMECDFVGSFSKLDFNCAYAYKLSYVDFVKQTRDGIYGILGSLSHDLIESFYNGETTNEKMVDTFISRFNALALRGVYFPTEKSKNNYRDDMISCLKNIRVPDYVLNSDDTKKEEFLYITLNYKSGKKVGLYGYSDLMVKNDGIYSIIDYKTSSKNDFVGSDDKPDKIKKGRQLILYAEMFNNMECINGNIDNDSFHNIKLSWNMLKYCDIKIKPLISSNINKMKKDELLGLAKLCNSEYDSSKKNKANIIDDLIAMDVDRTLNPLEIGINPIVKLSLERRDMVDYILKNMSIHIKTFNADMSAFKDTGDIKDIPSNIMDFLEIKDCIISHEYSQTFRLELLRWILDRVEVIERMAIENDYPANDIDFFCNTMCGHIGNCPKYQEVEKAREIAMKNKMNLM